MIDYLYVSIKECGFRLKLSIKWLNIPFFTVTRITVLYFSNIYLRFKYAIGLDETVTYPLQ